MKKLFIFIIKIYQYCISPMNPPCCRYSPSCSEYATQSFTRYNLAKAVFLTIKRIARCNPWGGSGFDPVPENNINNTNKTNA
jgi:putative membrane protein insertion efficiency factor